MALVLQFVGAGVAVISLAISAGALAVTAWQATTTARHERLRQEASAFREFNTRFADFAAKRRLMVGQKTEGDPEIHALYNEYWSLQLDQWEAFKRRVISLETYISWSLGILDAMRGKHPLSPSWEIQGRNVARNTPDFRLFCERLFVLAKQIGLHELDPNSTRTLRYKIRDASIEALRGVDSALRALSKLS